MKQVKYIIFILTLGSIGCNKLIDLTPSSNIDAATYYTNLGEINSALTGCYNGLQKPINRRKCTCTLTHLSIIAS